MYIDGSECLAKVVCKTRFSRQRECEVCVHPGRTIARSWNLKLPQSAVLCIMVGSRNIEHRHFEDKGRVDCDYSLD